jgi:hypothetical protein
MSETDTEMMDPVSQEAFAAEMSKLGASTNSGPLDQRLGVLGVLVALGGLAVTLVAYSQATNASDVRDQMESLILAIFGVGAVVLGSALYLRAAMTRFLRHWMLRLVYEQRDLARRPD